jgi:hypothetical protein
MCGGKKKKKEDRVTVKLSRQGTLQPHTNKEKKGGGSKDSISIYQTPNIGRF